MTVIHLLSRLKELQVGIRLENDRLKLNVPDGLEGALCDGLLNQLKENREAIIHFLRNIQKEPGYTCIEPAEKKDYYSLSAAQQRLYIVQQFELRSTGYNIPVVMILEGTFQMKKAEATFCHVIQRHESLRTSFRLVEGTPVQRIHEYAEGEFSIEYYDTGFDGQWSGSRDIIVHFIRPFDLSQGPLLRVGLIKTGENRHILTVDMHHIISDGTSMGIFVKEFMALYAGEQLSPLEIRYTDYSEWQNRQKTTAAVKKQEAYWLKVFNGEIPVLNLPTDYARPPMQSFEGQTVSFELDSEETQALKELAKAEESTLYMVLLALFYVFLVKLTGEDDIVVGTPEAGRRHPDTQHLIGMLVNTLALRNFPAGQKSFKEFLEEVRTRTLEAFENMDYQFDELVDRVVVSRDTSRNPLFDTMFVMKNIDRTGTNIPGLKLSPYKYENKTSKFDLTLSSVEAAEELLFTFEYSTKLFTEATIERFICYFKKIISYIQKECPKDIKLSEIEIILEEQKKQILYNFNDTETGYPKDKAIHRLFEEQVEKSHDHTALVGPSVYDPSVAIQSPFQITYQELNEKSNRLAYELQIKGVQSDTIVGIMVERSIEMIIGILSILKSEGAYLPIDPKYPDERMKYMLKDSSSKVLLASPEIQAKVKAEVEERCVQPQELPLRFINIDTVYGTAFEPSPLTSTSTCQVSSANLAYIIYTSGSTGKPKGVMIRHYSLVNRLNWMQKAYPIYQRDTLLQKTTFTFDVSVWEIFWWVLAGARLCLLVPGGEKDPSIISDAVEKYQVTVMHFVPSMLKVFLEYLKTSSETKKLSSLKQVITSGEALTKCHVVQFNQLLYKKNFTKLANLYGPTEATIDVSYFNCFEVDDREIIPIGKPIDNIHLYVVDQHLHLQPLCVPGELCIAGEGLARGYLNRPELTAEKFVEQVEQVSGPGDRCRWETNSNKKFLRGPGAVFIKRALGQRRQKLYRTGDLACWQSDGNIAFLGRIDQQVKIRGFRVELGEIESQLLKHEKIKEAVVVVRIDKTANVYLCAYIVSDSEVSSSELREYLSKTLPDYMVPSYFVPLETIPLTHNEKVNRKALPDPEFKVGDDFVPPKNEVEETIIQIWQEVLGIEGVGITDNFFEIGGDSIKAIQITARLKTYGLELKMSDLFLHPMIKELNKYLKSIRHISHQGIVTGKVELTPAQRWFWDIYITDKHHFNQSVMLYREKKFDETILEKVFKRIVEHHDGLRMVYDIREESNTVIQRNRGLDGKLFDLEIIPLTETDTHDYRVKKIETEAQRIQQSIDLKTGPLVKLALFKTPVGDHLLIVIHHLVVDWISWRILIEDFSTGYQQLEQGEEIRFQEKTDSYRFWAQKLMEYAAGAESSGKKGTLNELDYWKKVEAEKIERLPRDHEITTEQRKIKYTESITFNLKQKETELLVRKVNWAYNTEINDILLTALGMSIKEWAGVEKVLINLEGHVRESITRDVNVSRTIGWFAAQYPLVLDMNRSKDLSFVIGLVKETLRQIPNKGIGYGILRYLTPAEKRDGLCFNLKPQIMFNYLGQFGQENNISNKSSQPCKQESEDFIQLSPMRKGNDLSPEAQQMHEIEIKGIMVKGRLSFSFTFNKYEYERTTLEKLVDCYQANLIKIINHCLNKEKREITPSDVGYNKISLEDLRKITNHINKHLGKPAQGIHS
jgi:amino acid adenylation domain-containing protein/non-ribosomal peptide synthase protein (TIGR01720 family)